MYNNQYDFNNYSYPLEYQDDRFLFTPFLFGGYYGEYNENQNFG